MPRLLTVALCAALAVVPSAAYAQENRVVVDQSRMPREAGAVREFVPRGWEVEGEVSGDLNGDAVPDLAVKLVQAKRGNTEEIVEERHRALVVLLKGADGRLRRAAVADRLLQCTACGGAFYGVAEAPADVRIERGGLVINQDHGSRNVVAQTFRFRLDPASNKFVLIGYDVTDNDRATGALVEESTNFLTGLKIVKRSQYDRKLDKHVLKSSSRTRVARGGEALEQVDYEKYLP
ncbi:MAG TPA: hypothetical protein VGV38_18125 [Pyrinomonadaceae bacterium]|nr:hypothetical protein [Pyrinomonadaceae bacterium]